jgi:hypothetical protein
MRKWIPTAHMMISRLALYACCLLLGGATASYGQARSIRLTRVMELDSAQASGIGQPPASAAMDSRGRVVLTSYDGLPGLYSSTGAFEKELGSIGSGPGEFRRPIVARFGSADTLFVFDDGLETMSILDPGLKFVRGLRLELAPSDFVPLASHRFVVSAVTSNRRFSGLSAHLLAQDGKVVISFDPFASGAKNSPAIRPPLLVDSLGASAWCIDALDFVMISCGAGRAGKVVALAKPTGFAARVPGGKIASRITAAVYDGTILWTTTSVPRAGWERFFGSASSEGSVQSIQWDKLFDTVVQALDARTGQRLAELRFPGYATHFVRGTKILVYHVDAAGVPRLEVFSVSLSKR